jgi:predicted nucleotide-binding protein
MDRMDSAPSEPPTTVPTAKKREYLKQSDVPEFPLEDALRIARVIAEQYGKHATRPADIAIALDLLPGGRQFKGLSGSAVAYELTDAAAQAEAIGLTELGRRAVAPTEEGDDVVALREAFLRPRVIREFLERYDGSMLPTDERIGRNVLDSLGVPMGRAAETLAQIVSTAEELGLLADVRGKKVVNLLGGAPPRLHAVAPPDAQESVAKGTELDQATDDVPLADEAPLESPVALVPQENRKVFVSHGSNRKIVDQLKDMLVFGQFEPVISVERESTSKPVPEKVLDDMRSCGAGIIHVGVESVITDAEGGEHRQLNSNVLIEIGAAMALYGRNFILLVEDGTQLPSNLQGLYEVRYEGTTLDATATMRLLRAFNDFER